MFFKKFEDRHLHALRPEALADFRKDGYSLCCWHPDGVSKLLGIAYLVSCTIVVTCWIEGELFLVILVVFC